MTGSLGDRIKRLRLARDLTLKQVGDRAGVSPTHLSEIERGRTSPTVGVLVRIAAALGEDAAGLVDETPPRVASVVRAGERRQLVEGGVVVSPVAGAMTAREFSVAEVALPPEKSAPRLADDGEAFLLVLEGVVEVTLAAGSHTLREGDAIHYVSADGRSVRNPGDRTARLVWVSSPPVVL